MPVIWVFQKGILPDRYRECGFEAILAEYSSESIYEAPDESHRHGRFHLIA